MKLKDTSYGDMTGKRIHDNIVIRKQGLTSLEGAPADCMGFFDVSYNKLTTLKFAPAECLKDFDCTDNQLEDLVGAPAFVGGDFNCFGNKLKALKGAPKEVFGCFNCSENPTLKNVMDEIMKNGIVANTYITDEHGLINFKDIKEEFESYHLRTSVKSKGFRTLLGLKNEI